MQRQGVPLPPAFRHLVLKEFSWALPLLVLELGKLLEDRDLLDTVAMALHQRPILDCPLARIRRLFPMVQTTSY